MFSDKFVIENVKRCFSLSFGSFALLQLPPRIFQRIWRVFWREWTVNFPIFGRGKKYTALTIIIFSARRIRNAKNAPQLANSTNGTI